MLTLNRTAVFYAAALLCFAAGTDLSAQQGQTRLPAVVAEKVSAIDYTQSVTEVGEVLADESVPLVARVTGTVKKINFREGEKVKAGTVLFEIDPREYEAAVKRAEGVRTQKLAEKQNRDAEYRRQKSLYEQKIDSEQKFERIQAEKYEADAALLSAEADLDLAKLNLEYTTIKAPFDGWIGLRKCSQDELVGPNAEIQQLATIEKAGRIKVEFNLAETDLIRLQHNMAVSKLKLQDVPVELYLQDGKKIALKGSLQAWDNRINTKTGTLKMQAVFDDPDRKLIPGLYVKVKLMLGKPEKKTAIPLEAVSYDVVGTYVYVLKDMKGNVAQVERRYVKIADKTPAIAFLSEGLKNGEVVVVAGMQKIRAGVECTFTLTGAVK